MAYEWVIAVLVVAMVVLAGSAWRLVRRRRLRSHPSGVHLGSAMMRLSVNLGALPPQVEEPVLMAASRCRACHCREECRDWLESGREDGLPAGCVNRSLIQHLRVQSAHY
jgi:hypothetical protein